MLRSPSPVAALLLGLGLVIVAAVLPSAPALTILAGTIAVLSLDATFRKRIPLLLKVLLPFVLLMSLVALGRVIGGADLSYAVDEYVARFSFIVAVVTAATLFAACVQPWHALAIADACRLPKALTYVLVSLYPISSHVQELGRRQLALLDLKGVDRNSLAGRAIAYRRLVSPVFSSALTQQVIHARSLSLRGFFQSTSVAKFPRLVGSDVPWILLLSAMFCLILLSFL